MPEQQFARHVTLTVTIDGHDATDYMAPSLVDFTYTCNSGGKADEVQITLHNRDGHWSSDWKPKKGMPVEARIVCTDWEEPGEAIELPCGSFKIDEITFSGPPDKVEIKAVSADLTGGLRDTQKTRAWENTSLQTVAGQIAKEYKLELFYSGDAHQFERQDQRNEGDLAFLNRLANQFGMSCKAHDKKLVLFDKEQAEGQDAAMAISKTGSMYSPKSFSFRESSSGTGYDKAEAAYTDPETGTTHKASAEKAGDKSGTYQERADRAKKTMTLQNRAESPAQAAKIARAALHDKNSKENTASIEIMGCPRLVAGQTVALEGFGDFSATYFIKTATHRISGSGGYSTSLELSRPCPTREAGASEEVCEAALAAKNAISDTDRLNREADARARDGFEELLERLPEILQPVEELLLCLPEIAAAEAARAADKADRQGWEYLEKMFYRWFGGKANEDALTNETVFWVSLDWALKYVRVNSAFWQLASPAYLLRPAAKSILTEILNRDGFLPCDKRVDFDFTASDNFKDWERNYFQYIEVKGMSAYPPDGLTASMGTFVLRALAKGYIEVFDDRYIVAVTGISIYLRDSFNFSGDADLGYWQCEPPVFIGIPGLGGIELSNLIFKAFRQEHGAGNDFLVLSNPKAVDPFPGFVYEIQL